MKENLPDGTLIAIAGGKDGDPDAVFRKLDGARKKYPDMVLVHGGGPGVEKFAARWAEARGVHQVVCRPDWNTHGKAAPFRRNDDLLNLLPKGLILFPGSGITANLGDKAESIGIPVPQVQLRSPVPGRVAVLRRRGPFILVRTLRRAGSFMVRIQLDSNCRTMITPLTTSEPGGSTRPDIFIKSSLLSIHLRRKLRRAQCLPLPGTDFVLRSLSRLRCRGQPCQSSIPTADAHVEHVPGSLPRPR